jgi:hypothetical protein
MARDGVVEPTSAPTLGRSTVHLPATAKVSRNPPYWIPPG